MKLHRLQAIILFVLFSLVGCQQSNNVHPPTFSPSAVIPTGTFTSIPSQTATFTSVPTITATASPKPTSTITLTPLPKLSKDKIQAKLDQLYRYNNGCKLPCWWGITPGVTTWGEAQNFLIQFDEVSTFDWDSRHSLTENPAKFSRPIFRFPSHNSFTHPLGTQVDFEIQDGMVMAIKLPSDLSAWMFELEKLYKDYGEPDRILIVPEDCAEGQHCWAHMFYMYDGEGFMSQSAAYIKEINSTAISLCIFVMDSGEITTWAPGINIDFKTSKEDNPKLIPLDRITQEQIGEFFLKNSNREMCFDVPIEEWK